MSTQESAEFRAFIDEVMREWCGTTVQTPAGAFNRCRTISQIARSIANSRGLSATLLRCGSFHGETKRAHPHWRRTDPAHWVHFCVDISGVPVDFTARQFDPTAPVPRIFSRTQLEQEWTYIRTTLF